MIGKHLADWQDVALDQLEYLFIENVATWSAVELRSGREDSHRSAERDEGEDKPLKYPTLFNSADAAVITKMDIAEPCGFDREAALANIKEIRPGIRIFETSAKSGAGWRSGWLIWPRRGRDGAENRQKERRIAYLELLARRTQRA